MGVGGAGRRPGGIRSASYSQDGARSSGSMRLRVIRILMVVILMILRMMSFRVVGEGSVGYFRVGVGVRLGGEGCY